MRMDAMGWLAICAGSALLLFRLSAKKDQPARSRASDSLAARRPAAAFAPDEPPPTFGRAGGSRNAGAESMRSAAETNWDEVAEASDESFPASDPPGYLPSSI